MDKTGKCPLQITKGDPFIYKQSFYLMKHGGMGYIRITSVNLAWGDDTDRGFLFLHDTDLHGRCVSPQNYAVGDIKCILHISCRVFLGKIKGLKIIVIQLNIWALDYPVSHLDKYIADLSIDLTDRM